jgi:hypothetical protein
MMRRRSAKEDKRTPYEVLGVPATATIEEINKAYRAACLANHPDRNIGDLEAEERFKEASEAYATLTGKGGDGDPVQKMARRLVKNGLEIIVQQLIFSGRTIKGVDLPAMLRDQLSNTLEANRLTKHHMEKEIKNIQAIAGKFLGGCADLLDEEMQKHIKIEAENKLEFTIEVISWLEAALALVRECRQSGTDNPLDQAFFYTRAIAYRR